MADIVLNQFQGLRIDTISVLMRFGDMAHGIFLETVEDSGPFPPPFPKAALYLANIRPRRLLNLHARYVGQGDGGGGRGTCPPG